VKWLRSLLLRWHIAEAESHLRGCKQDGRASSYAIGSLQAQVDAYRVRLMLLLPRFVKKSHDSLPKA
jgi:hypothetical protein